MAEESESVEEERSEWEKGTDEDNGEENTEKEISHGVKRSFLDNE